MQGMTILINCPPPPVSCMAMAQMLPLFLASKEREQMFPQEVTCYLRRWKQHNDPGPKKKLDAREIWTLQLGSSQIEKDRRDLVGNTA